MKGAIFIALNEMIEQHHGIEVWEAILEEVNPQSSGIYTSTQDYPDAEICAYVRVISEKFNLQADELTKLFGRFLFSELNSKHPIFTQIKQDLFSFVESIEGVIHKEVRKLYEDPGLPTLSYRRVNDRVLVVTYQSPRKLCYLAEGLILGASDYYKTNVVITQLKCMHHGADCCELQVVRDD